MNYLLGNVVISGMLAMIGLALVAGFKINHPAMILAIMVVIFSIIVFFTDSLNTLGIVL